MILLLPLSFFDYIFPFVSTVTLRDWPMGDTIITDTNRGFEFCRLSVIIGLVRVSFDDHLSLMAPHRGQRPFFRKIPQ